MVCFTNFSFASDLFISGAFSYGGEKITDGSSGSEMRGGSGLYGAGGISTQLSEDIRLASSIGLKFDFDFFDNDGQEGTVIFSRFPIDVFLAKQLNKDSEIGAGLTVHLSPKIDAEYDNGDDAGSIKLKSSMGMFVRYGLTVDEKMKIGGQLTAIDYDYKQGGGSVGGNNLGIYIEYAIK